MMPEDRGDGTLGQPGRRNVLLLGAVSFINDTSSKIILPILPLFVGQLGGGGLAIGLISGISDSLASLAKLVAGYWSDRMGRRKGFVVSGYLLSSLAKLLLAVAASWPMVLLLRSAERLGKGLRSAPRDAILAASTQRKTRGRGFGVHRAMDSGGAVLGTLAAFGLYWWLELELTHIFAVAGVIGFLCLVPLLAVREADDGHDRPRALPRLGALPKRLRLFVAIAFLYALANFSYMFFVLASRGVFENRLGVAVPILLYGVYQIVFTVFAVPAGILSDRVGRPRVLVAGYLLFAAVCAGFVFAESLMPLLGLFVLYGLNYALVEANERALVSDLAHEETRGTALGAYHMATSLAALPAGVVAGLLWDLAPVYTFAFGGTLALAAALLLFLFMVRSGE
ncbi:MAG: MFS transporter [Chromatiales bacterium]|jgi:MFS family permease